MTLLGKITSYDYYQALEKLTDDSGAFSFKDRYASFRRTIKEYRHLRMLKRGGRGNDGKQTIAETRPGELAVMCPACPREGINLPANWKTASKSD
ncbi:hypothetical protein MPER_14410, partial [Moniliophthora perniciosa FA553]